MINKLVRHLGSYKKDALLGPLLVIGEVGLDVVIPLLMARIVDIGIATSDIGYIAKMGGLMVLMALCSMVFGAFSVRYSARASAGLSKNLREALFHKVQDFSFSNLDRFSTASLTTRLTTDVANTQNTVMMMLRMAVRAPVMLVCAVFMAMRIDTELVRVFLIAAPILAVVMGIIMSIAYPRFQKMLKQYDNMNAVVQENLIGIRVVKAFVREKHEKEKFTSAADQVKSTMFRAEKLTVFMMPVMQLVMYGCILAILWFGGGKVISTDIQTGDLMQFISYTTQILMSLMMIGMVFMMSILSRASISRIVEVLDEQPGITAPKEAASTVRDGSVAFKNVSFRYGEGSGSDTLRNINFEINAGETVGIIGATGSAKTTLVQLIPRLYDVQEGAVLVGGRDVREYDLKTLRDSVAMVLQNNVLFSGTIRENLKWGNENATDEEVENACKVAQAHDFIMSFPKGYETDLGQGGVNVSGGQKQRLCIARALLKKPKIMIMDDSTSAVDTATDYNIRKELSGNLAGMTTIVIAQRIASVMDSDKIMVMDAGEIVAMDTHDVLLETNEIYRDVYFSQQKGVEESA
ncbi:ABC transporter ATP-binding protein/permease [Christensenellaceae bacterium OttesenSCG-928-L17]|nr:ABC transporter ATP-binding protein/permease [Christensenellaceae bacterium OttesenSCG-928-L17]